MQVTHCPQCETAFKVSPHQLELAKGWVRCGRCSHVFEAYLYFTPKLVDAAPVERVVPENIFAPDLFRAGVTQAISDEPMPSGVESVANEQVSKRSQLLWVFGACLLSLVMTFQMLLWNRDVIVAEEPALSGFLSVLCVPSGCEINWPREPEAVLIESSSFMENPEGGYSVQLRLKNSQHHAVALPSLELSLTDIRDQVLVRRVFSAQELSNKDHLQALRDIRVNLNFDLDESVRHRITGFRAIVFYP